MNNEAIHRSGVHEERNADALGLETTFETFNPVTVDFYRIVGYLPDAVNNYLLLLGWSLDDRTVVRGRRPRQPANASDGS